MFFGSTLMQYLSPKDTFFEIGFLQTTELPLSAADANSATAVLKVGKMCDYKDNSETLMKFGTSFAVGFLTRPVSLNGLKDVTGFMKTTLGGHPDEPVTRGQAVTLQCPFPGAEAIFEGQADITGAGTVLQAIDHLVVKTGTGALSAATAIGTELSVLNGAWKLAAIGDWVLARMQQANYTPVVAGGVRIRVRFVAPYKKSA